MVNTWDAELGPTYIFGEQTSRIDFAVCKREHCDETSKHAQYLNDFPLNCVSGAHHVPQIYTLLKVWHPSHPAAPQGWTRTQRLELYRQWVYYPEATEGLQNDIKTKIASLPLEGNRFESVHSALNEFPAPKTHRKREAVHTFDPTPFQLFQEHSRRLRELLQPNLGNLFQAWFHVHRRGRARQQMRITSARARKQRIQKIFQTAGRAAAAKDHFRLYQAIRELAPKQPFRRIQIRDTDGCIVNPMEAADRIKEWFERLYHDPEAVSEHRTFAWPFTELELQQGLSNLPALKALSPGYAPAPFWHCAAAEMAHHLQEYLCECSEQLQLPRQWNTGSLCLIPKHARRSHAPQDLRPITLLEPCSKALLGTLAAHLFEVIGESLCSVPQYAYLPGRGTEDALARVFRHCDAVRTSCTAQQYPIQQFAQGLSPVKLEVECCSPWTCRRPLTWCPEIVYFSVCRCLVCHLFYWIFLMPFILKPARHLCTVARLDTWKHQRASDKGAKLPRPCGQHTPRAYFSKLVSIWGNIGSTNALPCMLTMDAYMRW